jgi:hypothetical protein
MAPGKRRNYRLRSVITGNAHSIARGTRELQFNVVMAVALFVSETLQGLLTGQERIARWPGADSGWLPQSGFERKKRSR